MYSFLNLIKPLNIFSGVADYVLLAPVDWFAEGGIKSPTPPFEDPGDEVCIWLDHEFKDDKSFVQFSLAPEKNKLDATTIGDKGFNKLDQTLEVFIPGSYAEVHEAIKNLLNVPLIALAPDSNCGTNMHYQLGSSCVFAYLTADFSTGTTKDGIKGYAAKLNYAASYIQLYYGSLPIQDVTVLGLSAVFLANLSLHEISGDLSTMEIYYNDRTTSGLTALYNLICERAEAGIIHIHMINDQGVHATGYEFPNLGSEMEFVEWLEQWITDNGGTQSLMINNSQLRILDEDAAQSFIGIAIPVDILGDGDYAFMANDSEILLA
jgi:hypothetical protein